MDIRRDRPRTTLVILTLEVEVNLDVWHQDYPDIPPTVKEVRADAKEYIAEIIRENGGSAMTNVRIRPRIR